MTMPAMIPTKYLYLNSRDEFLRLDISRIAYFESDGNLTHIILTNKMRATVGVNLARSGCEVVTMSAMPRFFLFGPVGDMMTGIGIFGNIYSLAGLRKDDTGREISRRTEEFRGKFFREHEL